MQRLRGSNTVTAFVKNIVGRWTIFAFVAFVASSGLAETKGLPKDTESYLDRPDILTMPAKVLADSDEDWAKIKAAHFSFIAFLLEAYTSDTKIFFLARDSEHLYDVARLVTNGTTDAGRIHLLNVSRGNMRDKNLLPYLKDNGISAEGLRRGEKVLFVDTGFAGTIPRVIAEAMPSDVRDKMKTHLLVSANEAHPSSRTFLLYLNPVINQSNPQDMHGSIVTYEHMPRFYDRSVTYRYLEGHWHPLSPVYGANDGSVSKTESEAFMKDLVATWSLPKTQSRFKFERKLAQWLRSALVNGSDEVKSSIKIKLDQKDAGTAQIFESQIRDMLEATKNDAMTTPVTLTDLGLKPEPKGNEFQYAKKEALIKSFPPWAPILENPDKEIPALFKKQDWLVIGNLIDANIDAEFNKLIALELYNGAATGIRRDLQVLMIEKAKPATLRLLAAEVFTKPSALEMRDLLELLISKSEATPALRVIITETLAQSHAEPLLGLLKVIIQKGNDSDLADIAMTVMKTHNKTDHTEMLLELIKKGGQKTMEMLAMYTLSVPQAGNQHRLLQTYISKADAKMLNILVERSFSKPHTNGMRDLVEEILKKGGIAVMPSLAKSFFSMPHAESMFDLVRVLIEKGDEATRTALAEFVFTQPHAQRHPELLNLLIQVGGSRVTQTLATKTFTNQNLTNSVASLRILIAQADARTLELISRQTLTAPHFSGISVLKKAAGIVSPAARAGFLAANPSNSELTVTPSAHAIDSKSVKTVGSAQNSVLQSAVSKAVAISADLKVGDIFKINKVELSVVAEVASGRRGVVFQVKNALGEFFALKVAKDDAPATLASIAQESSKAQEWRSLELPHSAVLVQAKNFVLKTWVHGITGEEVLRRFNDGEKQYQAAIHSLQVLVAQVQARGAYIGDFRPPNVMWTGSSWVIIDSGSINQNLNESKVNEKWNSSDQRGPKFERRWGFAVPPSARLCRSLF